MAPAMFSAFSAMMTAALATSMGPQAQSGNGPSTLLSGPSCGGLGLQAFDNSGPLSLRAFTSSAHHSDPSGVPLGLAFAGAITGARLGQLATFDELKVSQFQLSNGKLIALAEGGVPGNAGAPTPGSTVNFLISNTPGGSASFCAVPQGSNSILAVNGDTGSFQKCHATGHLNSGEQVIVFKPAPNHSGYDFETCIPIQLLLVDENSGSH